MSVIQPSLDQQKFYRSLAMPCPYIPGQMERKLFTRLESDGEAGINSLLTRAGFRRSHDIVYRPACDSCSACTPVRVPVKEFAPSDSQRRIRRRNADLGLWFRPARATHEQFALFGKYQRLRHAGGDMGMMNYADYVAMMETGTAATRLAEWRDAKGRLMAVMLADTVGDGLSAVYSFYEPEAPKRSLGIYMILELIEEAARTGGEYVYLGYYIPGVRKMEYKARFHPLEQMGRDGWKPPA